MIASQFINMQFYFATEDKCYFKKLFLTQRNFRA